MNRSKICLILIIAIGIFAISCRDNSQTGQGDLSAQGMMGNGTAWGTDAFRSNGERIYYTSTSERGKEITYSSGPASSNWMMMGGRLACVSCHGPYGRGGRHNMGIMQIMDSKDIRWSALKEEFDFEKFRLAVVKGQDPDGSVLKREMPRWNIGNDDIADIMAFLKTL